MKLGRKQVGLIRSLLEHTSWRDSDREWWFWDTRAGTRRVLDSLVKRGIVRREPANLYGPATYSLVDEEEAKRIVDAHRFLS